MDWPPTVPQGFPLTPTPRGYIKRIGGRVRWICGKLPPDQALAIYHRKAIALLGGGKALVPAPKVATDNPTLYWLLNEFVRLRRTDVDRGEMRPGSWAQYKLSAVRINNVAGHLPVGDVTPDLVRTVFDRLAADHGTDFARRAIGHLRTAIRYAVDHRWCPPVYLGDRAVARLASRPKPRMRWKLYTPEQVRTILAASEARALGGDKRGRPSRVQLHAMILLALNGGLGAAELSELTRDVVDLDRARLDFSRGKTGASHVVPLWPESVEWLKRVMALRPGDDLVFRTREGSPWARQVAVHKGGKLHRALRIDNVNERFTELVEPLGLKIAGQGFYKLRHLAQTIADECADPHATYKLFGHSLGVKDHYVRISEDRLRKVVEFVRSHFLPLQSFSTSSTTDGSTGATPSP